MRPYAVWNGPRKSYMALDHVRHAEENGCRLMLYPDPATMGIVVGEPVTCNDCQRAIWAAATRKLKSWRDVPKPKIAALR